MRTAVLAVATFLALPAQYVQAQGADAWLTRYIAGLNAAMPPAGDPARAADLFAADATQVHVLGEPPGGPQRNREEIRTFFAGFRNMFSDWSHVEHNRMTHGNRAVWEGVAQGHHRETGKPIRLPVVFFLTFDNGGAVREARVYIDARSIGDQLR
ncbi:MAG: nuclear transport factor 2 family protein [Burkholderiales bacterium]